MNLDNINIKNGIGKILQFSMIKSRIEKLTGERDEKVGKLVTESFNLFRDSKRDTHLEYRF